VNLLGNLGLFEKLNVLKPLNYGNLFTGVHVLKNNLEKKKYNHFLTLHFSISILLSDQRMQTMTNYAEELLKHFVT